MLLDPTVLAGAGAALAVYHKACGPAGRAEVICKIANDCEQRMKEASKDAKELSLTGEALGVILEQERALLK